MRLYYFISIDEVMIDRNDEISALTYTNIYVSAIKDEIQISRDSVNKLSGLCAAVPLISVKGDAILNLLHRLDTTVRLMERRIREYLPAALR